MDSRQADRAVDAPRVEDRLRGDARRTPRHGPLAVVLACTAGFGVQVFTAPANGVLGSLAPQVASRPFRYFMDVVKYRTTLCVGESAPYTVFVYRQSTGAGSSPTPVDTVQVLANPFDDHVGRFVGKDRVSSAVIASTGPGPGANPMPAAFTFKAGKLPGRTTLLFRANAHGSAEDPHIPEPVSYVSFQVDIRVIQCKYTVSGITSFPPDARDNPDIVKPRLVATLKKVQLVSDADGHLTGSTSIHWKSASLSSGCIVNETFGADGQVTINGDVADDGVLTLTFAFTSVAASAKETCGPASVSFGVPRQIDPLRVQVPMKGGVVTPKITLAGFPGVASIVVKPVKE